MGRHGGCDDSGRAQVDHLRPLGQSRRDWFAAANFGRPISSRVAAPCDPTSADQLHGLVRFLSSAQWGDHYRRLRVRGQSGRISSPISECAVAVGHVTRRVTDIWDKRSGALVTFESIAVDPVTDEPIAIAVSRSFIRGEGGFGGDSGPSTPSPIPDRAPDLEIEMATNPNQALLFRQTGDRNPLHVDPDVARRGGFPRPILHGSVLAEQLTASRGPATVARWPYHDGRR